MIYKPAQPPTEEVSPEELGIVEREEASLTVNGRKRVLNERSVVLGRSKECDVQVADANVSRRHAELRQEGSSWWVVDLDSTNGLEVNGKRVQRAKLADGDRITLGSTDVVFGRTRA
jgi:pSer/pThr/pTyr-binding forkhead associated (FHA) protein